MVTEEPVDVILICTSTLKKARILKVRWRHREYIMKELCMHWMEKVKGIDHHCYSIIAGNLWMNLRCNTQTFYWELREVKDMDETV